MQQQEAIEKVDHLRKKMNGLLNLEQISLAIELVEAEIDLERFSNQ